MDVINLADHANDWKKQNCKLSKIRTTWRENLDVLFDNLPAIKFILMEWVIW